MDRCKQTDLKVRLASVRTSQQGRYGRDVMNQFVDTVIFHQLCPCTGAT